MKKLISEVTDTLGMLLFACTVVGTCFIFVNIWIGLLSFLSGCLLVFLWSNSPEAKKAAKEQSEKTKREQEDAERGIKNLDTYFKLLSENPTNTQALDSVLGTINNMNPKTIRGIMNKSILPLLVLKPLDERVRATILACAQKAILRHTSDQNISSRDVYNTALQILEQNPEQTSLKQYALEVGRWHYSIVRPDGKVTIYDEQSIQNDILVRSR